LLDPTSVHFGQKLVYKKGVEVEMTSERESIGEAPIHWHHLEK
jgi:hypothetical protein